jgi:signal transduction histidine kinase
MAGRLTIRSELQQGTTVTVTLPAARSAELQPAGGEAVI